MSGPETGVRVMPDDTRLAQAAVELVEAAAEEAIARRERFTLVLAGGASPRLAYERLAARPLDWSRWHLFWGDERAVPPGDPASNYGAAASALAPCLRAAHVHRIPGELGAAAAAARYDAELAAFFGTREPARLTVPAFDLVLLGMGEDGHTASLFPGGVGFDERGWAVAARAPAGVRPAQRVTLTLAALASAHQVAFLVVGAVKRAALARVLAPDPPGPGALPAARVRPQGRLTWLVDRAAAGDSR